MKFRKALFYALMFGVLASCPQGHYSPRATIPPSPPAQVEAQKPAAKAYEAKSAEDETIDIATFNLLAFGPAKMRKSDVVGILEKIVRSFDIMAVQEIRDETGTALPQLLNDVNSAGAKYEDVVSERLGRSVSKEQYAFIYDARKVACTTSFTYKDKSDVFEREPFIAAFRVGEFDFVLVNIHTKPLDAKKEINALDAVVRSLEQHFPGEKDIIVLGDFNASCGYFKPNSANTALQDARYYWIVPDNTDTTSKATNCAYDRIVIIKDGASEDYTGKWGVFRFDQLYNLAQPEKVSDHFPVWAKFFTHRDSDTLPVGK